MKRIVVNLLRNKPITDGFVDQVESRVNSIVISNKIVPRYPFYILAIFTEFVESKILFNFFPFYGQ